LNGLVISPVVVFSRSAPKSVLPKVLSEGVKQAIYSMDDFDRLPKILCDAAQSPEWLKIHATLQNGKPNDQFGE